MTTYIESPVGSSHWGFTAAAKFLDTYTQWEEDSGFSDRINVDFAKSGDHLVHIEVIEVHAPHRQKGLGSAILDAICAAADRDNVILTLVVARLDEDGLCPADLADWYMSRGFDYEGQYMRRLPAPTNEKGRR